jgi:hypothetical protein
MLVRGAAEAGTAAARMCGRKSHEETLGKTGEGWVLVLPREGVTGTKNGGKVDPQDN